MLNSFQCCIHVIWPGVFLQQQWRLSRVRRPGWLEMLIVALHEVRNLETNTKGSCTDGLAVSVKSSFHLQFRTVWAGLHPLSYLLMILLERMKWNVVFYLIECVFDRIWNEQSGLIPENVLLLIYASQVHDHNTPCWCLTGQDVHRGVKFCMQSCRYI